ncbi:alanine racemase [Paenibacillus sp. TRM 82003]|uniref:alanine racemase n=1 Tax=Kineococcus sp. TRM81007 TaxID=2925831 RepID=UPI001F5678D6|nr:alanine racemase [Kineococcus sp. TRM81007]MCI2237518.1 alanine racemase [Kineococcus sp. TRM81007]MCI3919872.1 alanine racemase [Paenibacillus sp. TRM 82003]
MLYDAGRVGPLGPQHKAAPVAAWGRDAADLAAQHPGLSLLPTPLLTLDAAALEHNLAAMAAWVRSAGVDLAPHGKTTMAPSVWRHQLDAGACGLTVATPWQLAVALDAGVPWVLAAYPVLDPGVLALLARPRSARVLVWADGTDVVEVTSRGLTAGGEPAQPLDVLVELGAPGGRTGARSVAAALEVARAVAAAPGLRLAGVAGYEGALAHDAGTASLERVRSWLGELRDLHEQLAASGAYGDVPGGVVVSAGGSAYFDLVAEVLAPLHDPAGERGPATRTVVRAGAYVAHDDGFYRGISPLGRGAGGASGEGFRAALHGWVRVVSRPEPGLALADAGKRDLPFDEGLPQVQAVRRSGSGATEPFTGAEVTALNDQHAFVRLTGGAESLRVGDVLRLGVSHPCTAFDKWGLLPVLDDAGGAQPVLVDWVRTVFG